METYKKQKNRYLLCLFLFINNVDLKNRNRNFRKSFWIFWVLENLQLFQVDLETMELPMILLYEKQWCWRWRCKGCKHTPKSFDLLKIWAGIIPENLGENSAQRCLTS